MIEAEWNTNLQSTSFFQACTLYVHNGIINIIKHQIQINDIHTLAIMKAYVIDKIKDCLLTLSISFYP